MAEQPPTGESSTQQVFDKDGRLVLEMDIIRFSDGEKSILTRVIPPELSEKLPRVVKVVGIKPLSRT